MAINFPDNPPDGQEYAASNGIVYTYNAANDSWTGALGGNDYWSQDVGGNLYPTDLNADVWVGGDSSAANIVLDASGTITAADTLTVGTTATLQAYVNPAQFAGRTATKDTTSVFNFIGGYGGGSQETVVNITSNGSITVNNYDIDALDFLP